MEFCLRAIRQRLGLTQTQVAQRVGCTRGAISHWECGRQPPPLLMIPPLAAALGVPEALLLDLETVPCHTPPLETRVS